MVGLIVAADRFDHMRNARFSSYAAHWVRHNEHRTGAEKGLIHESIKRCENRRKITRARDRFETRYGHEPETEEVALKTGLPQKTLERTADKLVFHSMSNPVSNSERGFEFVDLFESDRPPSDELVDEKHMTQRVRDLLAQLRPREREVVRR